MSLFSPTPLTDLNKEARFDYYKERGDKKGMMAEPINLISNIAFFAAAFMCAFFSKSWVDGVLVAGIVLVGLGSSLYHSRPCKFTLMWDATAIVMWTLYYIFIWAHYIIGLKLLWSGAVVTAFLVGAGLFNRRYGKIMNKSFDYVPVIITLLICGSVTWFWVGLPHLVGAGVLAAVSLVFRSIDNDVSIPTGTHFVWHILNGFLMTMLTVFISLHSPV